MSFGPCNAPATFERIILHIFSGMSVGNFKDFLDDWSIYSRKHHHLKVIKECTERCRRARLALNPKKFRFMVPRARLLSHIVCKEGLKTNPDKINVIVNMEAPLDVAGVKSFLRHVGYYRRFIKGFGEVSLPLEKLSKKGEQFVWGKEQEEAFQELKETSGTVMSHLPRLEQEVSCPCGCFQLCNKHHIGTNWTGGIGPSSVLPKSTTFKSWTELQHHGERSTRYGLCRSKIRHYLLVTPFTFFVDHRALMYLVNKPIIQGRVSRWLILLREFTFKIIVCPGKSHVIANQLSRMTLGEPVAKWVNENLPDIHLFQNVVLPHWYEVNGQYLPTSTFPKEIPVAETRKIALKSGTFQLINGLLYKMGPNEVLQRCVMEEEISGVLRESHEGQARQHMGSNARAWKVLLVGLWLPTLYADAQEWVLSCDTCQRVGKPLKRDFMPLFPSQPQELFECWGLNFVRPLPTSNC